MFSFWCSWAFVSVVDGICELPRSGRESRQQEARQSTQRTIASMSTLSVGGVVARALDADAGRDDERAAMPTLAEDASPLDE